MAVGHILAMIIIPPIILIAFAMYLRRSSRGMCKWTAQDNTLVWTVKTLVNYLLIIPGLLGFVLNYTLPDV